MSRRASAEHEKSPHWYVYLLRCGDGSLYTGVTTDPDRRLAQHRAGTGAKYTRARGAVRFERVFEVADRPEALRLERRIKALSRPQKEALIKKEG